MVTIQELAEKSDINLSLDINFFSFKYELDKPKASWTSEEKERLKKDAEKYLPYTVREEDKRTSSFSKKGISIFLVNKKGVWGLIVANEGFDKPMVKKDMQHPSFPFDISTRLSFNVYKRIYAYISSNAKEEFEKEINKYYAPFFTSEDLIINDPTKKFHPGHKMERVELFKSTTKTRPVDPQNSGLYVIFWLVYLLKKAQTDDFDLGEGALNGCVITPPMLDELRERIRKAKEDSQNITWTWWEKFEVWDDREFERLLTPADIQFLLERDLEELVPKTASELSKEKEDKDSQNREKKEKEEQERKELERQRKEKEERDKRERTRKDQERLAKEKNDRERREEDRKKKEEAARLERERLGKERWEREEKSRREKENLERLERERRESQTPPKPPEEGEKETNEQQENKWRRQIEELTIDIDKYFAFIKKYIKPKFGELKNRVDAILPSDKEFRWEFEWKEEEMGVKKPKSYDLTTQLIVNRWESIKKSSAKNIKDEPRFLQNKASSLQAIRANLIILRLDEEDDNFSTKIADLLRKNKKACDDLITNLKTKSTGSRVNFGSEQVENCIMFLRENYGVYVTDNELPVVFLKRVLFREVMSMLIGDKTTRPTTIQLDNLLNYLEDLCKEIKTKSTPDEQFTISKGGEPNINLAELFAFKLRRDVYRAITDEVFKTVANITHYKVLQKTSDIQKWLAKYVTYLKPEYALREEINNLVIQTWQNFYFRIQIYRHENYTYRFFDDKTVFNYQESAKPKDFHLLEVPNHFAEKIDEDKYPTYTRFLNYWPAVFSDAEEPINQKVVVLGEMSLPPLQDNLCWGEPILFYEKGEDFEEFSNFHKLEQPIEISNEELRKRLEVPEPEPKPKTPPIGGTEASFPSAERGTEEPSTSELTGERERERERET